MVGDINIFIDRFDDYIAEINLMIAEPMFRRKGFGKEALYLMMQFANRQLNIKFVQL